LIDIGSTAGAARKTGETAASRGLASRTFGT
jgi:hypothetical protein